MIKTKLLPTHFQFKTFPRNEGWFAGYASVFDEIDLQNDRVVRGAFRESLQKWQQQGSFPKMLWQHENSQPIGWWNKVIEDRSGLYVEGYLLLDIQKSREAYAMLKAGILDSLSIGYRVLEAIQSCQSLVRLLTKIDLFEISLVTFAANSQAKVTAVKSTKE